MSCLSTSVSTGGEQLTWQRTARVVNLPKAFSDCPCPCPFFVWPFFAPNKVSGQPVKPIYKILRSHCFKITPANGETFWRSEIAGLHIECCRVSLVPTKRFKGASIWVWYCLCSNKDGHSSKWGGDQKTVHKDLLFENNEMTQRVTIVCSSPT